MSNASFGPDLEALIDACREYVIGIQLPLEPASRGLAVAALVEQWLRQRAAGGLGDCTALLPALTAELAGYGPLEALLHDPEVTEIMVNGPECVLVERSGRIESTPCRFRDGDHLRAIIDRLLVNSGRRLDPVHPMVDARLADGSRLNAVLPPIAQDGPHLTIRRSPRRFSLEQLMAAGVLDGAAAAFLHAAVLGRCNLLLSGGSGAGKSTMLAALAALAPEAQRMVVLEDVSELAIDHPGVVRLECRPAAGDAAEVTLRDLVRNSLRMRPDRIVVGEVRGAEAADMIQAMNTGHEGCLTTIHANGARDALGRLTALVAGVWGQVPITTVTGWLTTALDIVVHCERDLAGHRSVTAVAALDTDESGTALHLTPLFVARPGGGLEARGEVPSRCLERMARHGVFFPPRLFAVGRVA